MNLNKLTQNEMRKEMFKIGGWFSLGAIIYNLTFAMLSYSIDWYLDKLHSPVDMFTQWQYYALAFLFLGPAIIYTLARTLKGSPELTPPEVRHLDNTIHHVDKEEQQP